MHFHVRKKPEDVQKAMVHESAMLLKPKNELDFRDVLSEFLSLFRKSVFCGKFRKKFTMQALTDGLAAPNH
jgi:hypothetical protein